MNFYSNHSLSNKIGIIYSLTDRAILLSHEKYHNEKLNLVKKNFNEKWISIRFILKKLPKDTNFLQIKKISIESQMILLKLKNLKK